VDLYWNGEIDREVVGQTNVIVKWPPLEELIESGLVEEYQGWHAIHGTVLRVRLTRLGRGTIDQSNPVLVVLEIAKYVEFLPNSTAQSWIKKLTLDQLPEILVCDSPMIRQMAKERLREVIEG